jgi:hypothetical protein
MHTNVSDKLAASIFRVKGNVVRIVRLLVQIARNLNIQTMVGGQKMEARRLLLWI